MKPQQQPQLVQGIKKPLIQLNQRVTGAGHRQARQPHSKTVRAELPPIAVQDLRLSQGKLTVADSKVTYVPLQVTGSLSQHNPVVHFIIEDSSWNVCHDNTGECYNFDAMVPRRKKKEADLMKEQQLFNEEPPLTGDEVKTLLSTWNDFLYDSRARKHIKMPTIAFQQVTFEELAKKNSYEFKQDIAPDYPTPIILTCKTPQKFWVDLYDDVGKFAYTNDGKRVREFIKNHLDFALVSVSRLPVQWYFGKKSRELPESWWQTGERLNMNQWQRERFQWYYSAPQMFLNRTTDMKKPRYDVIYNYVPERHLAFLSAMTAWSLPTQKPREIGKWWSSLKQFGYVTDKGKDWDRPAIVRSYTGFSVSPYTFEPKATKASEEQRPGDIASANVDEIVNTSKEIQVSDVKITGSVPPSSDAKDRRPASVYQSGFMPSEAVQKLQQSMRYDITIMAEEAAAVNPPENITVEEWQLQRKARGIPASLDSKNALEYMRGARDCVIRIHLSNGTLDASGELLFALAFNDNVLAGIWNAVTKGKSQLNIVEKSKAPGLLTDVNDRGTMAGRARVGGRR